MELLRCEEVRAGYGGLEILQGVSLRVARGEVVCIIGPNGAGKSTLLKTVFGLTQLAGGRVFFKGRDITGLPPVAVVQAGIAYVPQSENVFPSLTVEENLEMGAITRRHGVRRRIAQMYELFEPLAERRHQRAGTLSGGQQQMVAIARALMLEPELLLLDEPTAGLAPRFARLIFGKIQAIHATGVGVLIVEQNARAALEISHRAYLLTMGRNRLEGAGREFLEDPEIGQLFLGA